MTSTRGSGHFGPLLPFADAFRRDGHRVLIAVPESVAHLLGDRDVWPLREADPDVRSAVFARTRDADRDEANRIVLGDLFAALDARAALPSVMGAVAEFLPDVLLHESAEFAGPLAAERGAVPCAHVAVGPTTLGESVIGWAAAAVDAIRRENGLRPDPDGALLYDRLTLSLTPPALDGSADIVHFREVRPEPAPLPAWFDGDARPLVYFSLGSVASHSPAYPPLYRAAIEQLAPLPVRLLVSTGRADPAALGPLPPNVRAEAWIDEPAVSHHASAMVTHGGAGSIRGALTAGLPLVVMPLFGDQPHNAAAVAGAGAGIVIDGPAGLAGAVEAALGEPAYRRRAAEIAAEVAALPPVGEAIGVLAQIADSTSWAARSPVDTAPFK